MNTTKYSNREVMKIKTAALTLVFILIFTFSVSAIKKDKLLHFGAGFITYLLSDQLNFEQPIIMVTGVSFTKEFHDFLNKDKHNPDIRDFIATVLGGFSYAILRW